MRLYAFLAIALAILGLTKGQLEGPSKDRDLFVGDFEAFTCHSKSLDLRWWYNLKGSQREVSRSDILAEKNTTTSRKSLIRIPDNIRGLSCLDATEGKEVADIPVSTNELHPVALPEEPACEEKPKIILKRWDQSFSSHIWVAHYVTNEHTQIPSDVTGLKLTCLSNKKLKWTIKEKSLKDFRYWTSTKNDCHYANLVLSPLNPTASQKFTCMSENHEEASVTLELPPLRMTGNDNVLDFNKTQECIEYLGTTVFGSKTLAWSTAGSSMMTIGMMMGVVYLKRQLARQGGNNGNGNGNQNPGNELSFQ